MREEKISLREKKIGVNHNSSFVKIVLKLLKSRLQETELAEIDKIRDASLWRGVGGCPANASAL